MYNITVCDIVSVCIIWYLLYMVLFQLKNTTWFRMLSGVGRISGLQRIYTWSIPPFLQSTTPHPPPNIIWYIPIIESKRNNTLSAKPLSACNS